jgi:lysozyme
MIPPSKPQIQRAEVEKLLKKAGVTDTIVLVGLRGYYLDTMGKAGENDRGIYDDALILISPSAFVTYNANVDPSVFRPGIATLKNGVWKYKIGIHGLSKPESQRYTALVQAAPVTVSRDGSGDDSGWFGINIHRGGRSTTSSLGCQTIPPEQWESFISTVASEMKRAGVKSISYLLTVR